MNEDKGLQVLITVDDVVRINFGLNLAMTAAAFNIEVTVFFAAQAPAMLCLGKTPPSTAGLLRELVAMGVELRSCSSCTSLLCKGSGASPELAPGVQIGGLADFLGRSFEHLQVISV